MLLISCHIIYIFLSFILCFMPANTVEVYVPEGIITVQNSDLYLYDLNETAIMIQTGSMSLAQTRPPYL